MYALCRPIVRAGRIPNATMIHGTDVTYPNRIYRMIVHPALRRAPLVIANSQATAEEAIAIGVRRERVSVVRLGVTAPPTSPQSLGEAADSLRRQFHIGDDQVILVTLDGWFGARASSGSWLTCYPAYPPNVTYLVAGDGPMALELQRAVAESGLERPDSCVGSG